MENKMKRYLKTPEEVIDALQAGKTLTDGRTTWKMYKGWFVRYGQRNGWSVGDSITSCYDVYVDEPNPLNQKWASFIKREMVEKRGSYHKSRVQYILM